MKIDPFCHTLNVLHFTYIILLHLFAGVCKETVTQIYTFSLHLLCFWVAWSSLARKSIISYYGSQQDLTNAPSPELSPFAMHSAHASRFRGAFAQYHETTEP